MSQLSKTAGKLWASIACEVSEDVILSELSAFVSLIKAQASLDLFVKKRFEENTDTFNAVSADYAELTICAQKTLTQSKNRDTQLTPRKYATVISEVLKIMQDVTEIAVKWNWIDFEDNTRFGSFLEEK